MTSNRRDLINGLAAAMGAGTFAATTYEGTNRYDKGTGTFYCNGHIISPSIVEKASEFFEANLKRCDRSTSEGNEMYLIYETAVEAIKLMRTTNANQNSSIVASNKDH
ncbi:MULTISPECIES: hypothetical protein [Butyrivibrio]|jgi:hypothetical protein|nr:MULTISPECIES: hypothetical protein [Butyrivibrio]MBQ1457722.1 hypothetical protein [Butyrivibrio sp.]SEP88405.1 hypothetical protein SAMN02910382_01327 [Butyrivibrio sp. TB]SES07204.1 hypothetical protein SAMN04487884_11827 [Butyrivibrio fibrisolvens]SHI22871.1 hypothetical protein SAMN02745229_02210 [Butyrivibrio fibrisolvens DSM 3071]